MLPSFRKRRANKVLSPPRQEDQLLSVLSYDKWSDERLVEAAQQGQTKAYEELIRRHQHRVYNLALRYTNDVEAALDLTQDAFLKAYEMLRTFRKEANFYTWFYRIVMNLCIDRHRRRTVRGEHQKVSLEALAQELGQAEAAGDDEGPLTELISEDAEEEAIQRETRLLVWQAVEALPDHLKQVVILREYEGLSLQQISEILKARVGTIKSRLYQARQALKRTLSHHFQL
ncbi:MAG: sigma-70 family RNA polymerase sigma factor [Armatimonadetes bacterium]|nr:sigma-70 family RNA polymerase sigma factor [Armatimonadota bacterium]MDW8121004.1 sigma-70 family RNA polymerase sigma factor [Armatimonadota bacterium]